MASRFADPRSQRPAGLRFYLMPRATAARSQADCASRSWASAVWRVTYVDEAVAARERQRNQAACRATGELELTSADVIHSFWVPRLAASST